MTLQDMEHMILYIVIIIFHKLSSLLSINDAYDIVVLSGSLHDVSFVISKTQILYSGNIQIISVIQFIFNIHIKYTRPHVFFFGMGIHYYYELHKFSNRQKPFRSAKPPGIASLQQREPFFPPATAYPFFINKPLSAPWSRAVKQTFPILPYLFLQVETTSSYLLRPEGGARTLWTPCAPFPLQLRINTAGPSPSTTLSARSIMLISW